ncbi:MMPL family transporter [Paenibacillus pasadenensis]|uniref:MMPL family transporter n=1 Tax=Paenibacillus pasadenensis TaxID=217090 RepID=UPI00203DFE31|nr:MMPL family transporter [Paenibacillus pasadenensis]MCM3748850.1 MMPL family transporter [Paenibacillus pasadenensis]
MAKVLYIIGGWAAKWRKSVLIGGIMVLVLAAIVALRLGPEFNGEMSIPGTESEKALEVMDKKFPSETEFTPGTIQLVFKVEGKSLESSDTKQAIQTSLKTISKDNAVESIADPYDFGAISPNKEIGYTTITYKVPGTNVTQASLTTVDQQIKSLRDAGIQVEKSAGEVGSPGMPPLKLISEIIGIALAFLILLVFLKSVIAAGMPIITAILGLGIGVMIILISTEFIDMSAITLTMAIMLGLAVGIDYGLFILSRHRQNLLAGQGIRESIAISISTAGSAVVFAGMTVIIALVSLSVTGIPFISIMGIAAALTILVAVLVAIIIVPAVLSLLGNRLRPKTKSISSSAPVRNSNAWGRFVTRFPLPVALVGILLLAFISLPALHLQTGLPNSGMEPKDTTERKAYDLLSEGFGPGFNGQLILLATADGSENPQSAITKATEAISGMKGVASVDPPIPNQDGSASLLFITPTSGPLDKETGKLVESIRSKSENAESQYGVKLMVTGSTAMDSDITKKLNEALPLFALIVVGLAFIILLLVFRSIIVPLKAVLGYLLTMTATLGFIVFVVQDGNFANLFGIAQTGPVLNFLPLLTAGILFGLAMDYEVFLFSRMREKFLHTKDAKGAILFGMKSSSGVVTAAALIMVCVFAGFIFMEDTMIKSLGMALAFGILIDAFVVRLAILPAIMALLGRSSWYLPKWLDRILPNIDIEGAAIEKEKINSKLSDRDLFGVEMHEIKHH